MFFQILNPSRLAATAILLAAMFASPAAVLAQAGENVDGGVVGAEGMVATAHPLASQAAIDILKAGGNAIDAAVAAAFVIGVVEPDGSGIGGGGGMTIWLNGEKSAHYINYYAQAGEQVDRVDYNSEEDRHTPKAVLIPGTVAGLINALERFGTLPLATVLEPAIRHANDGFEIDATLGQLILDNSAWLANMGASAEVFLEEGFPRFEGSLLTQPELAATLRLIAENGRDGFYTGPVAEAIVDEMQRGGGSLTLEDLRQYRADVVAPLEGSYRGYRVLTTVSPQSGSTVIESLNMLENADLRQMGSFAESAPTLHLMAQVFCRAYGDRWQFMGDPKTGSVPELGFISKAFARDRFLGINKYRFDLPNYRQTPVGNPAKYDFASASAMPEPSKVAAPSTELRDNVDDENKSSLDSWGGDIFDSWGAKKKTDKPKRSTKTAVKDTAAADSVGVKDDEEFDGHTTHLSVIDRDGNAVALTQTLGTFFGSGVMVKGVLLNCAMSNFSQTADVNIVKPGRQPRSSICPTIILSGDKPFLVVGSPGASRIICTVTELIVDVIDFGMGVDEANRSPRFYVERSADYLHLEKGISEDVDKKLLEMGHTTRAYSSLDLFFGGAQMILVDTASGVYHGSADPRRGGLAIGY